ncbi:hypothetical protein F4212_06795, partial [Candidatus Poribacteria bacterium]|nr:hypothetical protein [Candidatus Poribacteria bacterium]
MKQNPLILPIVGGGIALIFFFLPWLKIDMSSLGHESITISGFTFAIGSINFLTLAFFASAAIIGISIYMMKQDTPWKAKNLVLICSCIAVLCILLTFVRVVQGINLSSRLAEPSRIMGGSDMKLDKIISIQFGIFGAVIGSI